RPDPRTGVAARDRRVRRRAGGQLRPRRAPRRVRPAAVLRPLLALLLHARRGKRRRGRGAGLPLRAGLALARDARPVPVRRAAGALLSPAPRRAEGRRDGAARDRARARRDHDRVKVIGAGRASEILDVGDGRVLRRGGRPAREALAMRHAAAHGYPVPAVLEVRDEGLVLEYLDGPTMLADVL